MTTLKLKNHQIWQDLTEILENLDTNSLVQKHLEQCCYTINGYWDEQDKYYESITLPHPIEAKLVSSFVGITQDNRFLKLKFSLMNFLENIGELVLIYNENLELIDENWLLDIDSPMLPLNQNNLIIRFISF
ncbi:MULTISPECIES: hypothetical protein [Nostocales]|jgi:hypothetical protein|uniref:Uncharacterized protein n=1 Tax=Aphanizomenon flos-aquae FACHB-1040 TaxID=2692887 RepID=A0ABR8C0P8_APHFL|nr:MULTISPECIES: hypothetical protein [Nostocales]MBO1068160.1 hypothetical protein [Dolichospermum sp. DEX189]MCX5981162.1 hypothetical protein [Nostocales cyanobacterium LacPavin_0920_SED1_MAG_38_18]QSV73708.1 MAG: hypothetical protein HEQ20_26695 [Aphanizomenon flos-aquae KM1D3_PB]ALB41310.1 hypothetical protein AA650_13330 [Anabaena sp. WA102]KHG38941.1 hypothetical protein OA07_26690 [Aphanizomenon flos-aquae 2012/KM1/D3]